MLYKVHNEVKKQRVLAKRTSKIVNIFYGIIC